MAQYVAKLYDDLATDLFDYLKDYKILANVDGNTEVELRGADSAEAEAVADQLASLRDSLGLSGKRITYHVCRHDEGIGHCTGVIEK